MQFQLKYYNYKVKCKFYLAFLLKKDIIIIEKGKFLYDEKKLNLILKN